MEHRKQIEAVFHDRLRDPGLKDNPEAYDYLTSNNKWYSIVRGSRRFVDDFIQKTCVPGKWALDYACGNGSLALAMARAGARVTGIDISATSIENCKILSEREGVQAEFLVMDCEELKFPDNTFDVINVSGVLHHLDLDRAYSEMSRTLKPTGQIICMEALRLNPVFHLYRKLTPHLRTAFEAEHILGRSEVLRAAKCFRRVECRMFHLFTLFAVPFRTTPLFNTVLASMEVADALATRIPGLRWWAWQVAFVLSEPRKQHGK